MEETLSRPAGLMVLRVWTEPGDRMRVRVTQTTDLGRPLGASDYVTSRAEVLRLVGEWFDSLVTPG